MNNPSGFSTEDNWNELRPQIDQLWAKRSEGVFAGVAGVSIAYAYVAPEQRHERALVIAPGRTEFLHKYDEVVFDLCRQGYAVYLLDHRGQGLSGRWLADAHKGHVERFEDYVLDLQQFLDEVVRPRELLAPVAIGHSMGGAIVARHLQLYPGEFAAAALLSPMLEINTGAPQALVQPLLAGLEALLRPLGREAAYVPGGGGYQGSGFSDEKGLNKLTSSELRFERFNRCYETQSEIQLGAPTRHWLLQAFAAMQAILSDVAKIEVPVTVLMSGADRIVRRGGQRAFVERLQACSDRRVDALLIEGAEHELLMEADVFRLQAMAHLLDFIDSIEASTT